MKQTFNILKKAQEIKGSINFASTEQKNAALNAIALAINESRHTILSANQIDINQAKEVISEAMIDRLTLTNERIDAIISGIQAVIDLPDPTNQILEERLLENGLQLQKLSVPFGVLGMIYESRPNVTADVAALAIKSGNAAILRGGKEAFHTSKSIVDAIHRGLETQGLNPDIIQLIEDTTRQSAKEMMQAKGFIDLLIPRGGASLIQTVVNEATIPVIETGTGICHIYIDKSADLSLALSIVDNAKTSRPSVCNSAEVCLVHQSIAKQFLPLLQEQFKGKVQLVADEQTLTILPEATLANEIDFNTEFLDYKMAIKIVSDTHEAIRHINSHSTGHSESIISSDAQSIEQFTQQIDSAAIYVNASTRFTDGGEFGLGCEIGISTQKMHARGPMGLRELTTYKYLLVGNGQIRS